MSTSKKTPEFWRFSLINSLFGMSRMGIGATSVIYMLAHGANIADVAFVKMVQGVVIFFAEIPTGLVADTFGRKTSVAMACISAILSFLAYWFGGTLPWFAVGEILNALAISFWSGAFDALVIDHYGSPGRGRNFLELLFTRMGTFAALATMIGGLAGGELGKINDTWPFAFSSISMTITLGLLLLLIKEKSQVQTQTRSISERILAVGDKFRANLRTCVLQGFLNPKLKLFFGIQVLIQFAYQPLLHYWQPYIAQLGHGIDSGVLGRIFFAYVGCQMLVQIVVAKVLEHKAIDTQMIIVLQAAITGLSLLVMATATTPFQAIAGFIVVQGFGGSMRSLLGAQVNNVIGSDQRATILSGISFVSRIGMLVALASIKWGASVLPLAALFGGSGVAILLVAPLYLAWLRDSQGAESQMAPGIGGGVP
jgi:MFS family permease